MAYDLEEQEQLANLKALWSKYGNLMLWTLIIASFSYAGYGWWKNHQGEKAAQASALYDGLEKAIGAKDAAKITRITSDIETNFDGTIYGPMGALLAAKNAFETNDLKTAKTQLQWAIDHGNDEYKAVARLRLAGVLLDEKAYDDGLKVLAGTFLPTFTAAVAERKGDILVAQNKIDDARVAYQAALEALDKKSPARALLQLKLDAIGGAAVKAAA